MKGLSINQGLNTNYNLEPISAFGHYPVKSKNPRPTSRVRHINVPVPVWSKYYNKEDLKDTIFTMLALHFEIRKKGLPSEFYSPDSLYNYISLWNALCIRPNTPWTPYSSAIGTVTHVKYTYRFYDEFNFTHKINRIGRRYIFA